MPDESLPVRGTCLPPVPSVDAIVYSLTRHHLQPDQHNRSPASQVSSFAHVRSTDAPFPGSSASPLEVDPMYLNPPATPTPIPRRDSESASAGHTARHDSNRLRRKYSTNFSDSTANSHAKQTLVEGMIRSGTQCRVWNPSSPAPTDLTANSTLQVAPADCPLEVDHDTERDASLQDSSAQVVMSPLQLGAVSALERHGFPTYRTSREAALRSQNLVRNKPRMRKRRKVREKPSIPTIPAIASSAVASSSSPFS